MTKRVWKKLILWLIGVPLLLLSILISIVYIKQDAIVKELLKTANEDFKGKIEIKDSHISPFANFPYISIDLDHLKVYEDKLGKAEPIIDVNDLYLGFDLFTLLSGKMDIKLIKLSNGKIHIVQDKKGEFNINIKFRKY